MSSIRGQTATPPAVTPRMLPTRASADRPPWWRRLDPMPMLALPATLALGVAFGVPLLMLLLASVRGADGFTLASYVAFFGDPFHVRVVWNSLRMAVMATGICLVLGYPAAFAMARSPAWLQLVLLAGLFLPLTVSIIVKTFGWTILLRSNGLVNRLLLASGVISEPLRLIFTEAGLLIGMVNIFLPFMVLPLFSVVRMIDPRLTDAAACLGADPRRRFLRVTLPLSMPGVIAGVALTFSLTVAAYVTPTLLAGERYMTISMVIAKAFLFLRNWQLGATAAAVLLLIAVTVVVSSSLLARPLRHRG
jgi:putative spermidine/putrescine transport system permease protein